MNILIIRFSSIGDIVLTTAFIRQVHKTFPDAKIDYLIKESFVELIRHNPHLNKIYTFNTASKLAGLRILRDTLKENNYQYIFDLQNNLRSNFILKAFPQAGIGQIDKLKVKRAMLVYLKINRYNKVFPVPLRYLKTAAIAGVKDDQLGLELFLGNEIKTPPIKEEYIAIAPGAAHLTKRWPLEKFEVLINKLISKYDLKIILLGGKEDAATFSSLESNQKIVNFSGKLNLLESASIIKNAAVLISNDSSLMHISTAFNTPVVAIFGSTSAELGFFPFRGKNIVVEKKNLWCRPCTHIGRKKCPLGHFKCMVEITVDEVLDGVNQFVPNRI